MYMGSYNRSKKNRKSIKFNPLVVLLTLLGFIVVTYLLLFDNILTNLNKNLLSATDQEKIPAKNVSTTVNRVTPSTEFIFRYHYTEDDNLVEKKEKPSYYEINMTEEDLKEKYKSWSIVSFSQEQVVFEQKVENKAPDYYVIGEKDGYIAIYYENPELGLRLREIVQRPINSLPVDEQNKIKEGIIIYGEENLIKVLEDYTS